MYPQLRERAAREPWRTVRSAVERCTERSFRADGSYNGKLASMRNLMGQAALAYILFPERQAEIAAHTRAQLRHWEDLNRERRSQPASDWTSMITGGDAFFQSVIAVDVMRDAWTADERGEIEARLQSWYDYERDHSRGPWVLAKYGAMGLWALYRGDRPAFEAHAAAYDRRLRQHFTDDGVALVGGNYASARLAGGELAKTYFMDVLTRHGWHDYYADPLLGQFYEWFYAGMVTPNRHYPIFQDCRETAHSGTAGVIANYRAYRFSSRAAAHAAWLQPQPLHASLLAYALVEEPLPAPQPPESRLWPSGYAALFESQLHPGSLMAALWATDRHFHHDHFEVNAIHLSGYGQTLLRNSGYEGWGRPAPGFSWDYLSKFDIRPEWDYAVGGNIVYLNRDEPHVAKHGAGLEEGILHPVLDYVSGDAGEAVRGGRHLRSLLLVKDRSAGATPYFVVVDEMTRTDSSDAPMRVALHPPSAQHEIVSPRRVYRWAFADEVFLTVLLASAAGDGTRLKRGGLSQLEAPPMYLHAEFGFAGDEARALTVLYPHRKIESLPGLRPIAGDGYSGTIIDHGEGLIDLVLESREGTAVDLDADNGPGGTATVSVQARVAWLRMEDGRVVSYFVRKGRHLSVDGAAGFDADREVSLTMQGGSGRLVSSGTQMSLFAGEGPAIVRLGDTELPAQHDGGRVTVDVPAGSYSIEVTGATTRPRR
jgi:hypothetical protein